LKPLVIFGAGDIAELAHYYFTHDSDHEVKGFVVDGSHKTVDSFCGLPVVAFEEVAAAFPPDSHMMFVALAYAQINDLRAAKVAAAEAQGYRLASYLSSRATVLNGGHVGPNAFVLEDNTIQPFVTIGKNVTLWSGNHIGHHSTIGDNVFITSHVVVSGGVTIERNCFVGVNATIRNHVRIGARSVLGARTLILADVEPNGVYMEQPTERSKIPASRLRRI
jgi:sugar O-acyltransferase (sialic acid O-acetyltransferase NeuD family)